MLPILELAGDGKEHAFAEMIEHISRKFALTAEDRNERIPSGESRIGNRASWAYYYLRRAGLLEGKIRGIFVITQQGKDLLVKKPVTIDVAVLKKYPKFLEFHNAHREKDEHDAEESQKTPIEIVNREYEEVNEKLKTDLIERLKKVNPGVFEKLMLSLLENMGYGLPEHRGKSGDEGIDGVIQDKLGVNPIYIQAKRWENNVREPEIRNFIGSLDTKKTDKGILFTTAGFDSRAKEAAERSSKKIILIDGVKLAELMIEFDLGVSTTKEYKIKEIDNDYFNIDNE